MSSFFLGALGALTVLVAAGAARRLAWGRVRGRRGRRWMLRRVFRRIGMRPDQEAAVTAELEALSAEVRALGLDARDLRADVAALLAEPALDAERVRAAMGPRLSRIDSVRARFAEAIARVHAALEPAQREALAALVRAGPHRGGRCGRWRGAPAA
jgi:hypothetical protein